MKIEATLPEICDTLVLLNETFSNPALGNVQNLVRQNVEFNDAVIIKKNLLLGKVQLKATITATPEGCIEIDITSATVFGLGLFGVVRVKAAQILMQVLKPYEPNIYIWKHTNGNLRLQSPRLKFTFAQILKDTITLQWLCTS